VSSTPIVKATRFAHFLLLGSDERKPALRFAALLSDEAWMTLFGTVRGAKPRDPSFAAQDQLQYPMSANWYEMTLRTPILKTDAK